MQVETIIKRLRQLCWAEVKDVCLALAEFNSLFADMLVDDPHFNKCVQMHNDMIERLLSVLDDRDYCESDEIRLYCDAIANLKAAIDCDDEEHETDEDDLTELNEALIAVVNQLIRKIDSMLVADQY